ncbi:MAG: glycosyltransferase family 39 protein [Fibromonadales bacterium]|nr:glycosyltransferase family 39 protein [Fibromonadales bacterium]
MRVFKEPLLYLVPILVLSWFLINPRQMTVNNIEVRYNGNTEYAKFPIFKNLPADNIFTVSFDLQLLKNGACKYMVVPDDCIRKITINGKDMPLDGINGLCDLRGIEIDFCEYLSLGDNKIEFVIYNSWGPGGLTFERVKDLSYVPKIGFAIVLLTVVFFLLRKLKFGFRACAAVLLGIAIRLIFYNGTSAADFGHDFNEHIKYIQMVAEEKRIPDLNECWVCYHSPVYYAASAVVKEISNVYDGSIFYNILRQMQLLFSFATLAFGVALLFKTFESKGIAFIASLLWVVWPGFIIASDRISNEIPFYFGTMLCIYFASLWWKKPGNSHFIFATLGASLAFAFKSTGFVVLGAWAIIFVCGIFVHLASSFRICSLKAALLGIMIVLAFAAVSQHRVIVNVLNGEKAALIGNATGLNGGLKVKNEPSSYLYFDVENFLTEPYTSPWDDKQGRQYFWNYAFKTSLFGEFRVWDSAAGRALSTLISFFALISIAFSLWGLLHLNIKEFPIALFLLALFAALMFARIQYPYSCTNDFRFIVPALLPLSYFSIKGIHILSIGRLKMAGYFSIVIFVFLSLSLMLGRAIE